MLPSSTCALLSHDCQNYKACVRSCPSNGRRRRHSIIMVSFRGATASPEMHTEQRTEQTMSYTQLSRSDKVVWIRSFSSGCWCCRRHDSANPSGLTTSCPGCTRSHRVCESLAPGTLSLLEYICAQVQVLCEKISPDRLTRSATDSRQHRSKAACHTCDRKTSLSEAYRILLLLHNLGTEIDSIHSDRHIDR